MSSIQQLRFLSEGQSCRGDLYLPDGNGPFATVVMGHGFGLTRTCGLAPFRDAFLEAGYGVFLFDYRHFGESEGLPRQVLIPARELTDWRAALACVRQQPQVDNDRIVLWGTSFGGGLVTTTAAREPGVAAVIAQCPLMDGVAAELAVIGYAGLGQALKLTALGLQDMAQALLGQSPKLIPAAGRPGEAAAMSSSDAFDGYTALMPEGVPNAVAARIALLLPFFRPVAQAPKVTCPALVQICERDSVAPVSSAEKAAARMANATVKRYPIGHFDIYQGQDREQSIADQLAFLSQTLGG